LRRLDWVGVKSLIRLAVGRKPEQNQYRRKGRQRLGQVLNLSAGLAKAALLIELALVRT
jgi:hypothetical protein